MLPLRLLPALVVGLAIGCQREGDGPKVEATPSPAGASPGKQDARSSTADVTLRAADEKDLAELVAKHQGKVVLVDCWATWCGPCLEQFPHTVRLARKSQDKGLVVVSLNFNDPDDEAGVLDFLRRQGAAFDNLISRHGAGVQSFEAFDIPAGSLPHYMLFDRAGQRRKELPVAAGNGVIDPSDVERAVEKLLAMPPRP